MDAFILWKFEKEKEASVEITVGFFVWEGEERAVGLSSSYTSTWTLDGTPCEKTTAGLAPVVVAQRPNVFNALCIFPLAKP